MIKDYTVIGSNSVFELERMVLKKLNEGWELLGGIATQGQLFVQAMVLKEG